MRRDALYSIARRRLTVGCALLLAVAGIVVFPMTAGAAKSGSGKPPALRITRGPYRNLEKIDISVGPNRFYRPYSRIIILECGDRGEKEANLPIDDSTCDGNTVNANSVLVNANGSFSAQGYELFQLPSRYLGEDSSTRPYCDRTHACVLYIGENQGDFTWPKEFSAAFRLQPAREARR